MFKKILTISFLILLFTLKTQADSIQEPVQAGIKYNEATAKIEAFKDVSKKIDKNLFKDYMKDPNRKINIKAMENKYYYIEGEMERSLCPFTMQGTMFSYAIIYKDNDSYCFYYDILGRLLKLDIEQNENYPKKSLSYSRYGNLISVTFSVDENEQYIYDDNGKLLAHWIGNEMKTKNDAIPKLLKFRRGE